MILDAIRQGDGAEIGRLLAAEPALREARTAEGTSLVLWAVYTRHAELAPLLLGGREADLWEACALGDAGRVAAVLAANPGLVNAAAPDGFTPLGLACFFRHAGVARVVLDAGADASMPSANKMRFSPLHSAVADAVEIVALLLERGADANAVAGDGNTPLHSAAAHGNGEVIGRLLAAGADREARNGEGKTPGEFARQYGKGWEW
ncbi:MAG: ankyrin repeat domain-containing protein [Acidobacteriota bacterium]|nr:ankyrin repeat domain-containing protein [Acidobacteriota bacterium]